jgi:hypothetical protein
MVKKMTDTASNLVSSDVIAVGTSPESTSLSGHLTAEFTSGPREGFASVPEAAAARVGLGPLETMEGSMHVPCQSRCDI